MLVHRSSRGIENRRPASEWKTPLLLRLEIHVVRFQLPYICLPVNVKIDALRRGIRNRGRREFPAVENDLHKQMCGVGMPSKMCFDIKGPLSFSLPPSLLCEKERNTRFEKLAFLSMRTRVTTETFKANQFISRYFKDTERTITTSDWIHRYVDVIEVTDLF